MRIRVEMGVLAVLEIMRQDQARQWSLRTQTPAYRVLNLVEIMHQMMDRGLSIQDAEQGAGIFDRRALLLGRRDELQQQG